MSPTYTADGSASLSFLSTSRDFFFNWAVQESDSIYSAFNFSPSGSLFLLVLQGHSFLRSRLSASWVTDVLISFWSRFLSIGLLQIAAAAISVYNLTTSWRLRLVITI